MAKFCVNCGKAVEENQAVCLNCGVAINQNINNIPNNNAPVIQKRDIVVAILLSIITCGIYGLYWMVVMTDDANKVSGDNKTSGGMALLFSIITCGIYGLYWNYKMGEKMYQAGNKYGMDIANNSVLYLILSVFSLTIVNYCLIQSDLNKFAK